MERVIVYIDGFNLYFGLKSAAYEKYLWLDLERFAREIINPHTQQLVKTRYFTARISQPPSKALRQGAYLDALKEHSPNLSIHFGKYQTTTKTCRLCGHTHDLSSEKMTDVNIASELLHDLFMDLFDVAFVVSADSDLVTPIEKTRLIAPHKRVVSVFPPKRKSKHLRQVANGSIDIQEAHLSVSQLPNPVVRRSDGYLFNRPVTWI